jgi:predicted secreted protein
MRQSRSDASQSPAFAEHRGNRMRALRSCLLFVAAASGVAHAQPQPLVEAAMLRGVVNLSASASVDVSRDVLSITFSTARDGIDAGAVQALLKQALDAALVEARKVARPGQVDVQTGTFSITPRYAPKGGGITGWQGSAELVVEGRDLQAVGGLAGRVSTMSVARVAYSLSREVREKAESTAAAQAIARYRAKAGDYAQRFGYAGYSIREIHVNANEPLPVLPMQMRAKAMTASADEALPVEAGTTAVVVNVSGSIQLQ